jgi:hypothetical protein
LRPQQRQRQRRYDRVGPAAATYISAAEGATQRNRSTRYLTDVDMAAATLNPPVDEVAAAAAAAAPLTTSPIIERALPPQRWIQKLDVFMTPFLCHHYQIIDHRSLVTISPCEHHNAPDHDNEWI